MTLDLFTLHPNLQRKTWVADLPLCAVLLEDEAHYPWLILVPRLKDVCRMIDLSYDTQCQLMQELDLAQKILWEEFQPTQLNVAAIGNKTPQLHIHVIARFADDPAWPNTVWDHPVRSQYEEAKKQSMIERLMEKFGAKNVV